MRRIIQGITYYDKNEEWINVVSHAIGAVFSVIGLVLLVDKALLLNNKIYLISFLVYGLSLVILYTASTLYHFSSDREIRRRLNIFDHASIYILIAGTYTPYSLIILEGTIGWIIFGVTWGLALVGVVLKLFFAGKYDMLSTIMYVAMGWIIVFAFNTLKENLDTQGVNYLIYGGISYTIGAVLYKFEKLKFNHAIFHLFVLLGSVLHFISIYFYI